MEEIGPLPVIGDVHTTVFDHSTRVLTSADTLNAVTNRMRVAFMPYFKSGQFNPTGGRGSGGGGSGGDDPLDPDPLWQLYLDVLAGVANDYLGPAGFNLLLRLVVAPLVAVCGSRCLLTAEMRKDLPFPVAYPFLV